MRPKSPFQLQFLRPFLAFWTMIAALSVSAQLCAIDIGPDETICQGESVTLNGPPGYSGYLWSNGSTAQDIAVSAAGNYWVQVSYPTGELVQNGNFSGGNNGFNSQFTYSWDLQTDGNYFIGANAALYHPQFQGTGNGNFLMVNSGWWHAGWEAWCQTLPVCPGQTYQLSFRATSLAGQGAPTLQWYVNDQPTWVNHQTPNQGNWQNFTTNWTAPAGVTSADFCIRVTSGYGVGNDFGIDDVSISGTIVLTDDITVNVDPLPNVDLGPDALLCGDESLLIDAAVPGGTYLWQDGSTASSLQVNAAGNYSVTVTVNGCSASDQITVVQNPSPVVDLGPDQTLCEGSTIELDATVPGATYTWQDGSTDPTFTVDSPGSYNVTVMLDGCPGTDQIDIGLQPLPIVDLGPDQTICTGEQAIFDATTPGATYLWQDGSTGPTFTATTAGPVSVDVTVNGCTAGDAANVIENPLPIVDLGADQTVCPGTMVPLDATLPGGTYLWSDGSTSSTLQTDQPGTFWVEVTVNGCTSADTVSIGNFTLPVIDIADASFCEGASVSIGQDLPNTNFLWNTGETTAAIDVSAAGTYWVNATQNGCTVSDTVIVTEIPLPVVDLGADPSVCPGGTALLDATTPGATYFWDTGETTPTIDAGPGSYSVDVTVNGCTSSASIDVIGLPAPQVDLGNDTTLCPGEQLVIDPGNPGASFEWQDGSTASTFIVTAEGNYSVIVTDANGCSATDAIDVSYADPTTIDLGPDQAICEGEQLVLDATLPGATYLWNTGASTASITVDEAGLYEVTVTQGNCFVSDQINVNVETAPLIDLGNDTVLCPGETLTLSIDDPGLDILWNDGSSGNSIVIDEAGTYTVTVINAAGCSASDAIDVQFASPGAIDLGPDIQLCEGDAITLDATLPGADHLWSNGAVSPTITVDLAGTYWVIATQGACSVSDTIQVEFLPVPSIDLGGDQTVCAGEEVTLDASWPGATYVWNNGATSSSITVSESGIYSVIVDLDGCSSGDAVTITVLDQLEVDLGPDVSLCEGDQIVLDAGTPGADHLWSTGETSQTITVSSTGTYWVQLGQSGCMVSDTIEVEFLPVPSIDLGSDQTVCAGEEVILDASWPGATYAWNNGSTLSSITVSESGIYSVIVDLDGCSSGDAVTITVLDQLEVDLGPDVTLCEGDQLVLDAGTPGADHLWSTGATSQTITVSSSGTYWVQLGQSGCLVSDTVEIEVIDPGTIGLGPDQELCEGESATLDATLPNATYLWDNGSTGATRTITASGEFWVEATVDGCTVSDTISIDFHPVPDVELGDPVELCPGQSITFDVSTPGASYDWHDGSTGAQFTASDSGMVSVTVSIGNCSASDEVQITLIEGPVADLGTDVILCDGSEMTFDVSQESATYLWDDGSTSPQRTIDDEGTYWVEVTRNSCQASDTVVVQLFSSIGVDLGGDVSLCPGEQIQLNSPIPNAINTWSTGANTTSITIAEAGIYWLQVDLDGCSTSDTIEVTTVPLIDPDLGPDVTLCEGDSIELQVEPGDAAISWNTGSTSEAITVDEEGLYAVQLELDGCSVEDEIFIAIAEPITAIDLGGDRSICPGDVITLDATVPFSAEYNWNTGSEDPVIMIEETGFYSVEVIGECVDASASIMVFEGDCAPAVYVPNSFTPNGDGINDIFHVRIDGEVERYRLDIFDRWGEAIHTTSDPDQGWDGIAKGRPVQDGVYVWKLSYRAIDGAGRNEELIGHVAVIR